MLRREYISGSAGLLAVGAVVLVVGYAFNPLPQDGPISTETVTRAELEGVWLLAGLALIGASICLTLGIAAVLSLMQGRDQVLRVATAIVLAVGTIGMSGYGTVMVFLRALILEGALSLDEVETATNDPAVVATVGLILLGFVGGLVLTAWGLWRGRRAPRWIPLVIVAFVLSQILPVPGAAFTTVQFVVLAAALAGVAIAANDRAHDLPR